MKKKCLFFFIISIFFTISCISQAFAINDYTATPKGNYAGDSVVYSGTNYSIARVDNFEVDLENVPDFISKINKTIQILRSIALPLAAVALAYSALEMLFNGDKGMEKARARIKLILVAVAVIYLLPLIINSAASFASQYAWNPGNPSF